MHNKKNVIIRRIRVVHASRHLNSVARVTEILHSGWYITEFNREFCKTTLPIQILILAYKINLK